MSLLYSLSRVLSCCAAATVVPVQLPLLLPSAALHIEAETEERATQQVTTTQKVMCSNAIMFGVVRARPVPSCSLAALQE
jgi:hypothetical protein